MGKLKRDAIRGDIVRLYIEGELCAFTDARLSYGRDMIPTLYLNAPPTDEIRDLPVKSNVVLMSLDYNFHEELPRPVVLFEGEVESRGESKFSMGKRQFTFLAKHITNALGERTSINILTPDDYILDMISGSNRTQVSVGAITGTVFELFQPKKLIEIANKYSKYSPKSRRDYNHFDIYDYARTSFLLYKELCLNSYIKNAFDIQSLNHYNLENRFYDPPLGTMLNWQNLFTQIMHLYFMGTINNIGGRISYLEMMRKVLEIFLYEFSILPNPRRFEYTMQVKPNCIFSPIPTCNLIYPVHNTSYQYNEPWDTKPTRLINIANPPSGIRIGKELQDSFRFYAPKELSDKVDLFKKEQSVNGKSSIELRLSTAETNRDLTDPQGIKLGVSDLITEEERDRGIIEAYNELPSYLSNVFQLILFDKGKDGITESVGGIQVSVPSNDLNTFSDKNNVAPSEYNKVEMIKADQIRWFSDELQKLTLEKLDNTYDSLFSFIPKRVLVLPKSELTRIYHYSVSPTKITPINRNDMRRYYHLFKEATNALPLGIVSSNLKNSEITNLSLNKFALIGTDTVGGVTPLPDSQKLLTLHSNQDISKQDLVNYYFGGDLFHVVIVIDDVVPSQGIVAQVAGENGVINKAGELIGNICALCSINTSDIYTASDYFGNAYPDIESVKPDVLNQIKLIAKRKFDLLVADYPKNQSQAVKDLQTDYILTYAPPVDGIGSQYRISSIFGPRGGRNHDGVDIAVPIGTPVKSVYPGSIVFAGTASGYGNFISVKHSNGLYTNYGHLSKIYFNVGQNVDAGTVIGASGNSGRSTGPHLHFEVRTGGTYGKALDPLQQFPGFGKAIPASITIPNSAKNFPSVQDGPTEIKIKLENPAEKISPEYLLAVDEIANLNSLFSDKDRGSGAIFSQNILKTKDFIKSKIKPEDLQYLINNVPKLSVKLDLEGSDVFSIMMGLMGSTDDPTKNLLGLGGGFLSQANKTIKDVKTFREQVDFAIQNAEKIKQGTEEYEKQLLKFAEGKLAQQPEFSKAEKIATTIKQLKDGTPSMLSSLQKELNIIIKNAQEISEEKLKEVTTVGILQNLDKKAITLVTDSLSSIAKASEQRNVVIKQLSSAGEALREVNEGQKYEELDITQKTKVLTMKSYYIQPLTEFSFYCQRYRSNSLNVPMAYNPYIVPGFGGVIIDNEPLRRKNHLLGYVESITQVYSHDRLATETQMGFVRSASADTFGKITSPAGNKNVVDSLFDQVTFNQNFYKEIEKIAFFGGEYSSKVISGDKPENIVTQIDDTYARLFGNSVRSARREDIEFGTGLADLTAAYKKTRRDIQTCLVLPPIIGGFTAEYNRFSSTFNRWYNDSPSKIQYHFTGSGKFPDTIIVNTGRQMNPVTQSLIRSHTKKLRNKQGILGLGRL